MVRFHRLIACRHFHTDLDSNNTIIVASVNFVNTITPTVGTIMLNRYLIVTTMHTRTALRTCIRFLHRIGPCGQVIVEILFRLFFLQFFAIFVCSFLLFSYLAFDRIFLLEKNISGFETLHLSLSHVNGHQGFLFAHSTPSFVLLTLLTLLFFFHHIINHT